MRKVILMSIVALGLIGCGTTSTRTEAIPAEQAGGGTTTTTVHAGGDVVINDVIVTGNGIYIYNSGSGDITYVGGDFYNYIDEANNSSGGGASITGMSEETCKNAGYFWCTLNNVCIDNGGAGGTGSCSK